MLIDCIMIDNDDVQAIDVYELLGEDEIGEFLFSLPDSCWELACAIVEDHNTQAINWNDHPYPDDVNGWVRP